MTADPQVGGHNQRIFDVDLSPDHEPTVSKALTVATHLPATKHNANPREGQAPDGDSRESAIALLQVGRFTAKWIVPRRAAALFPGSAILPPITTESHGSQEQSPAMLLRYLL